MPSQPIRIAIVNDYALVVAGLAKVLEPFADRVVVVELDSRLPVVSEVDVVLYDSFAQHQGSDMDLDALVGDSAGAPPVVVFSWNTQPALVESALASGARGYVSKGVDGADLVRALERVVAGERVTPAAGEMPEGDAFGTWPGADYGLSAREAEVLALLCQGLSNQEIAERAFIGMNTVKTHLRIIFQKLGVDSRTRAALWGVDHGFRPDISRTTEDPSSAAGREGPSRRQR